MKSILDELKRMFINFTNPYSSYFIVHQSSVYFLEHIQCTKYQSYIFWVYYLICIVVFLQMTSKWNLDLKCFVEILKCIPPHIRSLILKKKLWFKFFKLQLKMMLALYTNQSYLIKVLERADYPNL